MQYQLTQLLKQRDLQNRLGWIQKLGDKEIPQWRINWIPEAKVGCDAATSRDTIDKGFEIVPKKICSSAESEERRPSIVNVGAAFQFINPIDMILLVAFYLNFKRNWIHRRWECCSSIDEDQEISNDFPRFFFFATSNWGFWLTFSPSDPLFNNSWLLDAFI